MAPEPAPLSALARAGAPGGRTATSLAKYLSHVRGLLEYAWRSGRAERNVLDGFSFRTPRRARRHGRSRWRKPSGWSQPALGGTHPAAGPPDRAAALRLRLAHPGAVRLDVGDVNRERRELQVRHAKGDRPRVVPIPDGVYTELLAYLLDRGVSVGRSSARRPTVVASRRRTSVSS